MRGAVKIYLRTNVGWPAERVPLVYLCGGVVTLVTAQLVGNLTDRVGKVRVFRWMAVLVTLPMMAMTLTAGLPQWAVLGVSTAFFVCMSGRMIPGMALNSATQSAAMGAAALVGGQIISRDAHQLVQHYWVAALIGSVASLMTVWLAGKLKLHGAPA